MYHSAISLATTTWAALQSTAAIVPSAHARGHRFERNRKRYPFRIVHSISNLGKEISQQDASSTPKTKKANLSCRLTRIPSQII